MWAMLDVKKKLNENNSFMTSKNMWKVAVYCKKIGIVLFKNFNLLIYQQAVAILMWAPIQNFFLLFSCFWWEANLQNQSWMPAMMTSTSPSMVNPANSSPVLVFTNFRLQSTEFDRKANLWKVKCRPFVKNCIPRSTSLIPLSSNALNTFYKTRAKLPIQFSGFSRLEELWSNMTFSESRPRWVWFSFWFNWGTVLMQKCQWDVFQSGKHQLSMAVLFVIVWISRTVNTRWEVMRKGVTGSKEVRPAWLCPTKKQLKRPILSQPLQSGSSEEEVSAQQNKDFI